MDVVNEKSNVERIATATRLRPRTASLLLSPMPRPRMPLMCITYLRYRAYRFTVQGSQALPSPDTATATLQWLAPAESEGPSGDHVQGTTACACLPVLWSGGFATGIFFNSLGPASLARSLPTWRQGVRWFCPQLQSHTHQHTQFCAPPVSCSSIAVR